MPHRKKIILNDVRGFGRNLGGFLTKPHVEEQNFLRKVRLKILKQREKERIKTYLKFKDKRNDYDPSRILPWEKIDQRKKGQRIIPITAIAGNAGAIIDMSIGDNIKKIENNINKWWNNKNLEWKDQAIERRELNDLEKKARVEGYKEEIVKMARKHGKKQARLKYEKPKQKIGILGTLDNMGTSFNKGIKDNFNVMDIGNGSGKDNFKVRNEGLGFLNATDTITHDLKKDKKLKREKKISPMDWGF